MSFIDRFCIVPLRVVTIVAGIVLVGCGVSTSSGPSINQVDATYVDSVMGSDISGTGNQSNPFKTITYAITVLGSRKSIELSPGEYNAATGETFPISLPQGAIIHGSGTDISSGGYSRISGSGTFVSTYLGQSQLAAVVIQHGGGIGALVVEAPNGVGIWDESDKSESGVISCLVQASQHGIVTVGTSASKVQNNVIQGNISSGIQVLGNSSPTLIQNKILLNGVGVTVGLGARPLFKTADDYGMNTISGNSACNLRVLGEGDLDVVGTIWDTDVFSFVVATTCVGGTNISLEGIGTVIYQLVPTSTSPLFGGTRKLNLISPVFGATTISQEPAISWDASGTQIAAAAIFDRPPIVGPSGIVNTDSIIWYWYSGLSVGAPGFANFSDGISLNAGNLSNASPPQALQKGRSYYWAAWEWDPTGQVIAASTNIGFFTVLP